MTEIVWPCGGHKYEDGVGVVCGACHDAEVDRLKRGLAERGDQQFALVTIARLGGPDLESSACAFGVVAHAGQKYGDGPYAIHLTSVRGVLAEYGFTSTYLAAAWLHDVIEDTDVTREFLRQTFPRLADLVWAVTGCGKNRKERVADAMAKIRECPAAIPLKLADRIANVRAAGQKRSDLFAMYAREYTAFVSALRPASNPDDGRETAMWLELDRIFRGAEDSR